MEISHADRFHADVRARIHDDPDPVFGRVEDPRSRIEEVRDTSVGGAAKIDPSSQAGNADRSQLRPAPDPQKNPKRIAQPQILDRDLEAGAICERPL
jgi:hypothetical protein